MVSPLEGDRTQELLIRHLAETERNLRSALRVLDSGADCQICAAADLGVPYDPLRLGGGFASGCVVDWTCRVPIVPVDTTMNVDLTTVYELTDYPEGLFDGDNLSTTRKIIEQESIYQWNFDSGNHFISLCVDDLGGWRLVLHSNDREFKSQYNGLYPSESNWYGSNIVMFGGRRPIRLLIGDRAELFLDLCSMLPEYGRLRHRLIAECLLRSTGAAIKGEGHKQHYGMIGRSTASLGAFLCAVGEVVLIFSDLGNPLVYFESADGGHNDVRLLASGDRKLVVPHGWGVEAKWNEVRVDWPHFWVDDRRYVATLGESLFDDVGVSPRRFVSPAAFLNRIAWHTPGRIVGLLEQRISYSRHGVLRHGIY